MTDPQWQDRAACRNIDPGVFFPPCTHRGYRPGETCDTCGDLVPLHPEHWSPQPARAICATCPVRVECLLAALGRGEQGGIWAGAGGDLLKDLRRAYRNADHDGYRPRCHCAWCVRVRAHLAGLLVDRNTGGVTHGKGSTYARGCRCPRCALRVTVTGQMLHAAGVDIATWWAAHHLPIDDDLAHVTTARELVAADLAGQIRRRLIALHRDAAWLTGQLAEALPGDRLLAADNVALMVGYRSGPCEVHLSPKRARALATVLEVALPELVDVTSGRCAA